MTLDPGIRLGRYEIVELIGAGGMGEVYRAHDDHLDREVAIKVLPESIAASASSLDRFQREARAVAALEHPGILAIHDFGVEEEGDRRCAWAAMELLRGQTLRDRLAAGPVPARKAVELARQLAEALAAAHDQGIVHRDIKPENLFVNESGQIKVLDFGLASEGGEGIAGQNETSAPTRTSLTHPGTVLGTVGYMSPEQVRGEVAGHRSDLFSFGCVLYEMLTGSRAFERDTPAETMTAVLREEPPGLGESTLASLPQPLERVLWRCLEKNASERFHSASDLAFALASLGTSSSSKAATVIDPAPWRFKPSLGGLLLALVAIAIAFVLGREAVPREEGRSLTGSLRKLTFEPPGANQPSIAPDGDTVVYTRRDEGDLGGRDLNLYLHRIGGENPIHLTPDSAAADYHPAFSPDGQRIAFCSDRDGGGIFVMGATGESVRRLADFGYNPAWSPDGKELVVATEAVDGPFDRLSTSELWRLDVATGARKLVTEGDAVQPSWSPSGKHIVFWGLPPGSGRRVIQSLPAQGGEHRVLVDDGFTNWTPRWYPDGKSIVYASDRKGVMNLWRQEVDSSTGAAVGEPTPVTFGGQSHGFVSVARDGTLAFAVNLREYRVQRASFDLETLVVGPLETVLETSRATALQDVSRSGERLVMRIDDGHEDLMIMQSDGSGRLRLSNDRFRDRNASFDAEGDSIYFNSTRNGPYEVWSIRHDGSELTPVYLGEDYLASPFVSPDGRWLAGHSTARLQAGIIDLEIGIDERVVDWIPKLDGRGMTYVSWSPDGKRLLGEDQSRGQDGGVLIYTPATGEVELVRETGRGFFLSDERILIRDGLDSLVLELSSGDVVEPDLGDLARFGRIFLSDEGTRIWQLATSTRRDVWILRPDADSQ